MLERSLSYVLDRRWFRLLAAGRTDSQVSVNQTFVELFVKEKPLDLKRVLPLLNKNLPQDLRVLDISETDESFNIIQESKAKEYLYFFSVGEKFHPFCAPLMINVQARVDLAIMKEGAKLFEGEHDFWSYTYRPKPETQTKGRIYHCEIVENDILKANFFPDKSYVLRVEGSGFKRYQIRLMMGALIDLGKGIMDLKFLRKTLAAQNRITLTHVAKASGLVLNAVEFKKGTVTAGP